MRRSLSFLFVFALVVGCGDDETSGEPTQKSYPALPAAPSLDYTAVELGVGVRAGDVMAIANFAPEELQGVVDTFPHAVYRVQSYDEATQSFGEYVTFPAPSTVSARGPVDFIGPRADAGRHSVRVDDLSEEVSTWLADAGASEFKSTSVVLDFWRIRNDWWVRWDGLLDGSSNIVGQGAYGFNRQEFYDELIDEVASVALAHKPKYFVIGTGMEQTLGTSMGGLAPAEMSNFHSFFQTVQARIKEVSPSTKVAVGFNWDRFAKDVAPLYAPNGSENQQLDAAFEAVILPFLVRGDVLALSSYTQPADINSSYGFLRRIADLYGVDKPVVYFSIGSPVDNPVDAVAQANYLEDFARWNAGVNVEFVAWRAMVNFDGADTADQIVKGRCAALTGPDRQIEMDIAWCYDGLFTSIFSPKEAYEFFTAE